MKVVIKSAVALFQKIAIDVKTFRNVSYIVLQRQIDIAPMATCAH